MVSKPQFLAGMKALQVLPLPYGVTWSLDLVDTYYGVLASRFDNFSWAQAVGRMLETQDKFPAPAAFFKLHESSSEAGLTLEAARQFELACQLDRRDYNPHTGTRVRLARIKERCDPLAVAAFAAVGGEEAFNGMDEKSRSFLRKDFVAHYLTAARVAEAQAQRVLPLPRAEQKLLEEASNG